MFLKRLSSNKILMCAYSSESRFVILMVILMMDEDEYTPSSSFQCRSFSTGIEKKKDERRKRSQEGGIEKKRGEQLSWQRDDREM